MSGARVATVAALSIERASGAGPFSILPKMLGQARTGAGILYTLMLTLAVAVLLASTFTSTILLSDFSTVTLTGPVTTAKMGVRFRDVDNYTWPASFASY